MLFILVCASLTSAAQFSHKTHKQIEDLEQCEACHERDALTIFPEQGICKNCHTMNELKKTELGKVDTHGSFWYREHKNYNPLEGTGNEIFLCSKCHQEAFCLDCHKGSFQDETKGANIHRSDYLVTHPIKAKADSRSCSACHEKGFCNKCHNRFRRADLRLYSHRRRWSDLPTTTGNPRHITFTEDQCQTCHPKSVLPAHAWSSNHAREARRDIHMCQTCHEDADVCIKCHSARTGLRINPHPRDWHKIKKNFERASDGETCRRCH